MTEPTAKMCPYRLTYCWEHGCQMWKELAGDCGLKRIGPEDEVIAELGSKLTEAQAEYVMLGEHVSADAARIEQLESELSARPTEVMMSELREDLEAALSVGTKLVGTKEELEEKVQQLESELAERPTQEALERDEAIISQYNQEFDRLKKELSDHQAKIAELEFKLDERPTQEQYQEKALLVDKYEADWLMVEKELSDVRQELETLRTQGGRKSRRKEKPVERES